MSNWVEMAGHQLFKVQGGYAFKSSDYVEDGIGLVRIGDISKGKINFNGMVKVPFNFLEIHKDFALEEKDVLIGMTGDLGKICIVEKKNLPLLLNQRVGRFITNDTIDKDFLYYLFSSPIVQNMLSSHFSGGAQQNISPSKIESIELKIPNDIEEQRHIAMILKKTDELITQIENLISKYKRIKISLIQDLLTKGVDEEGNLRSEETHEFKVSPIGKIPVEWNLKELKDVAMLNNHLRKPISAIERSKIPGDYPYYGATGIIDRINQFKVEGEHVLMGEDGDHFLKWKSQEMTILTKGKFNVSNHAHIIRGTDNCLTKWIHYYFVHRDITFYLTRQGAGRFKLNKESLLSLPILVPKSIKEQNLICKYLEVAFSNIDAYESKLGKLKKMKTGLMLDLLTGKVNIDDLIQEGLELK